MEQEERRLIFFAPRDFKDGSKILGLYLKKDFFILTAFVLVGLFVIIGMLLINPRAYKISYLVIGIIIIMLGTLITMPAGIKQSLYRMILETIKYAKRPKNYIWKGRVIDDQ